MGRYTTGQARNVAQSPWTWWGKPAAPQHRGTIGDKSKRQVCRILATADKRSSTRSPF